MCYLSYSFLCASRTKLRLYYFDVLSSRFKSQHLLDQRGMATIVKIIVALAGELSKGLSMEDVESLAGGLSL